MLGSICSTSLRTVCIVYQVLDALQVSVPSDEDDPRSHFAPVNNDFAL